MSVRTGGQERQGLGAVLRIEGQFGMLQAGVFYICMYYLDICPMLFKDTTNTYL